MTRQTLKSFALALSLLGTALIPSTSLAQVGLASKLPGKNPATAAASHQAKTPGAPSYTYTLLSFPGSLDTDASGLNPGATTSKIDIVGIYSAGAFLSHVSGTKTIKETYEAVTYPHNAVPIDINDLGQIVGQYVDGSGVTHGFEMSDIAGVHADRRHLYLVQLPGRDLHLCRGRQQQWGYSRRLHQPRLKR